MNPAPAHGRADGGWTLRRFAAALAVLIFAAFPKVCLGLYTFVHRDFGLFGYPLALFHRDCFWRGELPLWNPFNNLGLPFLAQWNTLTLYPGSLFYLLFPMPWSLNAFCLSHLWLAGVGMYWLALRWTGSRTGAAVAGVAFAFNGLSLNALMWPNNIAALGWMPWVVGAAEMGWRKGGRALAVAALAGTMQMLTGAPEIILFTWSFLGVMWIGNWLKAGPSRGALFWRLVALAVLVFAMSGAQLLPFLDLLKHSHRDANFGNNAWAMPIWGWLNFLVPGFRVNQSSSGLWYQPEQFWTSSYYTGGAVLALALWAALRLRQPRAFLLLLALAAGAVLALGDAGKLFHWLRLSLPAANVMRYPIKFVVVAVFALPLLAAFAVRDWSDASHEQNDGAWSRSARLALTMTLLLAGVAAWSLAAPLHQNDATQTIWSALRTGFFLLVALTLLTAQLQGHRRLGGSLGTMALLLTLWLDALTHAPWQNPTVPSHVLARLTVPPQGMAPAPELGQGRALLSLSAMTEFYTRNSTNAAESFRERRIGLPNSLNLIDQIPKVDGFFSLYLPEERRVHFRLYGSDTQVRPRLADFLGVTQVSATSDLLAWTPRDTAMPLVTGGQQPVFLEPGAALTNLISSNFEPQKYVLMPPEAWPAIAVTNGTTVTIHKVEWLNHRVRVEAESTQAALIVFSQAHYHPWQARVDGEETGIWRANVAFQAVEMPAGRHVVELIYLDHAFRFGCALSLAGLALTGLCWRRRAGVG
jgi:Bacterial membrane protein YfhO